MCPIIVNFLYGCPTVLPSVRFWYGYVRLLLCLSVHPYDIVSSCKTVRFQQYSQNFQKFREICDCFCKIMDNNQKKTDKFKTKDGISVEFQSKYFVDDLFKGWTRSVARN